MFCNVLAMYDMFMEEQPGGRKVKITEIYNDVINESVDYEFKAELNPENPIRFLMQQEGCGRYAICKPRNHEQSDCCMYINIQVGA